VIRIKVKNAIRFVMECVVVSLMVVAFSLFVTLLTILIIQKMFHTSLNLLMVLGITYFVTLGFGMFFIDFMDEKVV